MSVLALDWAFTAKKVAVYDGKRERIFSGEKKIPKLKWGDVVVCENIPDRLARPILESGAQILRCGTHLVKEQRKVMGWEKKKGDGDELDAVIIWHLYNQAPELFRPYWGVPRLRALASVYRDLVKQGVALQNRLWHQGGNDPVLKALLDLNVQQKKELIKALKKELRKLPIWTEWLDHIHGVGPAIGAVIVGYLGELVNPEGDIRMKPFRTPSSVWHYLGLHVDEDGKAAKRKKGQRSTWREDLKPIFLHDLGEQFERKNSEYRRVYDAAKETKLAAGWTKGHARNHAVRKAVKRFLADLWVVWKVLDGLEDGKRDEELVQSMRPPYPIEYGNHGTYYLPPNCPERVVDILQQCLAKWSAELGKPIIIKVQGIRMEE